MPHDIFHPVNLNETQQGYVPLRDRFKSFPVDRVMKSIDEIYFLNRIGQRLEHSTLDMILKVPSFVRSEVQNRGKGGGDLPDNLRVTEEGDARVTEEGDFRVFEP